jgi:hypothetical protein
MTQFAAMRKILTQIEVERLRQITAEGYRSEHDSGHQCGELAVAAAAYIGSAIRGNTLADHDDADVLIAMSPWSIRFKTGRNSLIKAAALLIAEIERLDRET